MGDIREMMLDGTLCEGCGCNLAGPAPGYPRYCSRRCQQERQGEFIQSTKVRCPACHRMVKRRGLSDHMRDAHGGKNDA